MTFQHKCDIYCYDEVKVQRVKEKLQAEEIGGMAQMLKAIADENRAKIAYALCEEQELCVCDIANIIGSTVANTSHHLRTLHRNGVVKFRKEGKLAFYSLDDDHIRQIVMMALAHRKEVKVHV